jgi:hypothetical protein
MYASSVGKTANCQTSVSLTLARGEVPVRDFIDLAAARLIPNPADRDSSAVCGIWYARGLAGRRARDQGADTMGRGQRDMVSGAN